MTMKQPDTIKSARRIAAAVFSLTMFVALVMALFISTESGPEASSAAAFVPESPVDTSVTRIEPLPVFEDARVIGRGQASFYGPGFDGRPTANGETFRSGGLTAAHKSLPFGTKLRVTNLGNGKSVVVRVNDRGPFVAHRILDLSQGAASRIGMISSGTAQVQLEVLA